MKVDDTSKQAEPRPHEDPAIPVLELGAISHIKERGPGLDQGQV